MAKRVVDSGIRNWTPKDLPDLSGKTYVVTGANVGLGFHTAKLLGSAGGRIVLACRSLDKAQSAQKELEGHANGGTDIVQLDLTDFASIRSAAAEVRRACPRIDGLINNAGIMQTPPRKTKDGFELQFGTNHLGHFLWTSLLIDLVEEAAGRVVVVSSIAHKMGAIHFDDLMLESGYTPTKSYTQSKLANLLFAFELDRRLRDAGCKAICVACHPGYSNTMLQSTGPTGMLNLVYKLTNRLLAQSAEAGAYPTVLAAAGKEAQRGAYYGPTGMAEARGPVGDALVADHALDQEIWRKLWETSERLIGAPFDMPDAQSATA